jgi:hypothetical protein
VVILRVFTDIGRLQEGNSVFKQGSLPGTQLLLNVDKSELCVMLKSCGLAILELIAELAMTSLMRLDQGSGSLRAAVVITIGSPSRLPK